MADEVPLSPNPNYLPPAVPSSSSNPLERSTGSGFSMPIRRPPLRLTTEFDSEGPLFSHKLSCKFFDSLAKLKFSFQNNANGEIFYPQLSFITKNLSVLYDVQTRNALLRGAVNLGKNLLIRTTYDVQEQLGAVAMIASLPYPSLQLELSSSVPSIGWPRAALQFPYGEIVLEKKEKDEAENEVKKALSVDGILKSPMLNGMCTVLYNGNDLSLRYLYKDEKLSFIPSVNLPSNKVSFAFKRQFSPSDKLSYWYHFDSSTWSAVYKHTIGKDLKIKAGYDSEPRLGWASLWVGSEEGKAKEAPMKLKAQMMLQIPQDDIRSCAILFRVKKRWDF